MKLPLLISLGAAAGLHAQTPALTTDVLDAAGGHATGGNVEMESSLGGFGVLSTGAGAVTARAGFPGQLYDPATVAITPGEATLQENNVRLFTAEVVCDDATLLPASALVWSVDNQYLSVSSAGEVSTGLVPEPFAATLTATAGSVSGTALLTITDSDPDNYRDYAGDGLPDAWQILHFGESNPGAAPAADPDADGQDNQTEYLAGTDPNDAASFLQLRFGPDPAPGAKSLLFTPFLPDRTYTLEWSATLAAPWTVLPDAPTPAAMPGEGEFTDTPAEPRTYYRVRITVP
jgi:hypothetical protein